MSDRRMVYPYTLTAKIRNNATEWHFRNNRFFKSYIIGGLLALPLFWKIQKLSLSEENLKAEKEYRRKEQLEFEEHKLHLL